MYILGIESSCDESAAAIIKLEAVGKDGRFLNNSRIKIISSLISSQIEIHKKYGGVVPEIAAREHVLNILPVIDEALKKAKMKPSALGAIGITKGPGLITSLITGLETARALSFAWNKPLVEVNHIAGHIYANFINRSTSIKFPAIILTVSGGHTILMRLNEQGKIKILGETRDDAAGEAFDKAAKMMKLGYPGGPAVSRLAAQYLDAKQKESQSQHNKSPKTLPVKLQEKIQFPRPMLNSPDYDFSFSGLKTSLLYALQKDKNWQKKIPTYCYEYQQAIIDILISKTLKAAIKYKAKSIMLTGGVSANTELRQQMSLIIKDKLPQVEFIFPDLKYTTDNAAMIAAAAAYLFRQGKTIDFKKLRVNAGLQLK